MREATVMDVKADGRGRRIRIAGSVLLILAALMFVSSFVVAAKTPIGRDLSGCQLNVPCDATPDPSKRQDVFFMAMGATLVVLTGGLVLRSVGHRS